MTFLQHHQLSFMLILSSICGLLAFFVFVTKTLSKERKRALMFLEIAAMLLLLSDRNAYLFSGDNSDLGQIMTRVSNFAVFYLTMALLYGYNMYLIDLFRNEGKFNKTPARLVACKIMLLIGQVLIITSQFTRLYYYFDEVNTYHRGRLYFLSYIFPLVVLCLQLSIIIQYYKRFDKRISLSLVLFAAVTILSAIVQFFVRGLSMATMTMACFAVVIYMFSLWDLNDRVEKVNELELNLLREERKKAR